MIISASRSVGKDLSCMTRYDHVRADLRNALKGLDEALAVAKSDLEVDGVLQRFEFTFELFWKTLKLHLEQEGIIANTPKQCFKEAYRLGLIRNESSALRMLDDRNLTVHLYDQKTSREVFERVRTLYLELFREALNQIG